MNAKRLTVQRVMTTLVLLVSALLGMAPLPAPRGARRARQLDADCMDNA